MGYIRGICTAHEDAVIRWLLGRGIGKLQYWWEERICCGEKNKASTTSRVRRSITQFRSSPSIALWCFNRTITREKLILDRGTRTSRYRVGKSNNDLRSRGKNWNCDSAICALQRNYITICCLVFLRDFCFRCSDLISFCFFFVSKFNLAFLLVSTCNYYCCPS